MYPEDMIPNIENIVACVNELALAMKLEPLPEDRCINLIRHVLYIDSYNGVEGKGSLGCFNQGIITPREFRNLLMAHAATKIAGYNQVDEPGCDKYSSQELCSKFALALLGRSAKLLDCDVRDPWEN